MGLGRLKNALNISVKVTKESIDKAECDTANAYFRGMLEAYNEVIQYLDIEENKLGEFKCQQDAE